jgi:hypothetical protein
VTVRKRHGAMATDLTELGPGQFLAEIGRSPRFDRTTASIRFRRAVFALPTFVHTATGRLLTGSFKPTSCLKPTLHNNRL